MTPSDLPIVDELGREFSHAARRALPPARPPGRRAPRTRRLVMAAAVLVAVAVGAGALAGGDDATSLAERAYAAVAPPKDAIRHVIAEATIYRPNGQVLRQHEEFWSSPDGCRARVRYERPPGNLVAETTHDANETRTYMAKQGRVWRSKRGDVVQLSDPVATFRRLYRRGQVREAGRARLDGEEVIRFEMRDSDMTAVYLADAKTFVPRELRVYIDGRLDFRDRILVYETLPAQTADQVLTMPQRPGVEVKHRDAIDVTPTAPPAHPPQQCSR